MKGCETIEKYSIKREMENNEFAMSECYAEMNGNVGVITNKVGDNMTIEYNPKTESVEGVE